MDSTDLISVIIPTYNRAHLIKRSVESVLNQTYKNLELIIVDDGSTDNTKDVIDSIKDERIRYFYQVNQGVSAARNKGIELAKGKYIAFQDSDDVWHSDKLEKQIRTLKENNADIVFGKILVQRNLKKRKKPDWFKTGFLEKDTLPIGIGTQNIFAKKNVFLNNKFDLTISGIEDFEVLLRIKKNYSIYCIDEPLIDYYIQQDSISNNNEKELNDLKKIVKNNKNFLNEYSHYYLEILALFIVDKAVKIKNPKIKKEFLNFAYSISSSKKIKIRYFCHKFYFYKIRELLYKSISIPTKNIIKIFKTII